LIACGVQDLPNTDTEANNFGFTADDIGDYLYDVLQSYDRDYSAIEFVSGDNCYVNQSLCTKLELWLLRELRIKRSIPLIGCASHRLNLAVQKIYSEVTNPEYFNLVLKVQSLMVDLRTLKNKIKLLLFHSRKKCGFKTISFFGRKKTTFFLRLL